MQLDPLLLAIAVPLAVAAAIFAGLPKRYSVRLAGSSSAQRFSGRSWPAHSNSFSPNQR